MVQSLKSQGQVTMRTRGKLIPKGCESIVSQTFGLGLSLLRGSTSLASKDHIPTFGDFAARGGPDYERLPVSGIFFRSRQPLQELVAKNTRK